MVTRSLAWIVTIVLYLGSSGLVWSDRGAMSDELRSKLRETLSEYAKLNSLNEDQLQALLRSSAMEDLKLRKGGVGIIDKDTFVFLDYPKNTLRVSNKMWSGESADHGEIVVTDGQRVSQSLAAIPKKNIKIIIFAPGEVRFIDPTSNTGGRYLRYRQNQP